MCRDLVCVHYRKRSLPKMNSMPVPDYRCCLSFRVKSELYNGWMKWLIECGKKGKKERRVEVGGGGREVCLSKYVKQRSCYIERFPGGRGNSLCAFNKIRHNMRRIWCGLVLCLWLLNLYCNVTDENQKNAKYTWTPSPAAFIQFLGKGSVVLGYDD